MLPYAVGKQKIIEPCSVVYVYRRSVLGTCCALVFNLIDGIIIGKHFFINYTKNNLLSAREYWTKNIEPLKYPAFNIAVLRNNEP
jgi:hypothetical protein